MRLNGFKEVWYASLTEEQKFQVWEWISRITATVLFIAGVVYYIVDPVLW